MQTGHQCTIETWPGTVILDVQKNSQKNNTCDPLAHHFYRRSFAAECLLMLHAFCAIHCARSICRGTTAVVTCMLTAQLFSAVLLSCVITRGTIRICLPERRSADQNTMMSKLAKQAEAAWQLPGHPGWYAAKCMEDGDTLLDLLRQKVPHLCTACHHLQCQQHRLTFSHSCCCVCLYQVLSLHCGACTQHWLLPQALGKSATQSAVVFLALVLAHDMCLALLKAHGWQWPYKQMLGMLYRVSIAALRVPCLTCRALQLLLLLLAWCR